MSSELWCIAFGALFLRVCIIRWVSALSRASSIHLSFNCVISAKVEKVDLQETDREGDLGAPHRQDFAGNRTHKLATYANMAVMANKLTSKTRDRLPKTESEPSEQDRVAEDMAVAAMGAKHTEQQLLRASRSDTVTFFNLRYADDAARRSRVVVLLEGNRG